jgi:tetratricopeptide (TPR) repeat protein
MDNDPIIDEQENLADDQLPISELSSTTDTSRISLSWQIAIAIGALLIVGLLSYPFLQKRFSINTTENDTPSSEVQTAAIAPETTVQADPESAAAQFELGNAYVQSGQLEQAVAAYQKAIELDPNYEAAYANLGVVYYQLQRLDLAVLQYQKALELNPDDGEVAYNLGALYLQQALLSGDQPDPDLLDQAIAQLQQAQELSPNLAEPYFSLGVAYDALNRSEEAIEAFETFLARDTGQDPRAGQEAQRYLENLRAQ